MHYFQNPLKFVPANNRSPKVLWLSLIFSLHSHLLVVFLLMSTAPTTTPKAPFTSAGHMIGSTHQGRWPPPTNLSPSDPTELRLLPWTIFPCTTSLVIWWTLPLLTRTEVWRMVARSTRSVLRLSTMYDITFILLGGYYLRELNLAIDHHCKKCLPYFF